MLVADGPRENRPDDQEKCATVRAIVEQVDWPCEVQKNFAETNLGCKRRVSSGLDWVFEQAEEAIILEDDCLPTPSFFRFCTELLSIYRDDYRVMAICGSNALPAVTAPETHYHFSRVPRVWGWASWRRSWKFYDVDMKLWPWIKENDRLRGVLRDEEAVKHWKSAFDKTYRGAVDTWDYQLVLSFFVNSGLAIIPNLNLVQNIGFGENATHTTDSLAQVANLNATELDFPIRHPQIVLVDQKADDEANSRVFGIASIQQPGIARRIWRRMHRLLNTSKNRNPVIAAKRQV